MEPSPLELTPDDMALIASAIEQVLQTLQQANEKNGGKDPEVLEYGRRYSLLLQKITSPPASPARGRR